MYDLYDLRLVHTVKIVCTICTFVDLGWGDVVMASKMKGALSASLRAESDAVRSRFDRADSVMGETSSPNDAGENAKCLAPEEPSPRVVRDTFTFPENEYVLISQIQDRCLQLATMANKSEILRAGLKSLSDMSDEELLKIFSELPKIKPGRPSRKKR